MIVQRLVTGPERWLKVALTLAAVAAGVSPVVAQAQPEGWRHTILVYGLAAGLSGETAVRGLEADVDVGFSEVLEDLEAGGMAAYRAESKRWAVMANVIYMGLGATKDAGASVTFDVDIDQWLLEVDGSWRYSDRLEFLAGLRFASIDVAVESRHPTLGTAEQDGSESWVDPVVGARVQIPIGKSWSFTGRGDIGGFGVGSDLTWQAVAQFQWRLGETLGLSLGYLAIYADYEDGDGSDLFRYDVTSQGPFAGMMFSF